MSPFNPDNSQPEWANDMGEILEFEANALVESSNHHTKGAATISSKMRKNVNSPKISKRRQDT
jgi:hypothetical protein